MTALELEEIKKLEDKIKKTSLPSELEEKALGQLKRVEFAFKFGGFSGFEQVAGYIDWIISLPWEKTTTDTLDLSLAQKNLDENHYALTNIKERILEYLAVLKLNKQEQTEQAMRAPIICFVGLVGTGKTTLALSIAQAMGRKFARIPFGGMGSTLELRGQSRVHPDAEPGQVTKALRRCGSKNPVILLDEIDRVAEHARSDIMGVLVELLDPEQNIAFTDHYIDFPFDLSQVLFVATANNTTNISTAVLDRIEPLEMPSYSDEEKIAIAKGFLLPKLIKLSGLSTESLKIDDAVWPIIVRPLGYDAGIRTLERTLNGICRKVAKLIVEGKGQNFQITELNIKQFLPQ